MKRIIKLTEQDLQKIVKRVIKEQGIGNYIDVLGTGTGIDLPSPDIDVRDCLEYNSGKNKMSQLFTYVSKLPTGQITPQVQKWNDRLYKAMKGLGTGEDYINVLKELKTPNDLAMIYKTFNYEGENLWEWMSGESKYSWDDTFNAVPQSVRNPAKIPLCLKSNPNRYGYTEQYSKNKKKRLNEENVIQNVKDLVTAIVSFIWDMNIVPGPIDGAKLVYNLYKSENAFDTIKKFVKGKIPQPGKRWNEIEQAWNKLGTNVSEFKDMLYSQLKTKLGI